jgi:hypothetical protein
VRFSCAASFVIKEERTQFAMAGIIPLLDSGDYDTQRLILTSKYLKLEA